MKKKKGHKVLVACGAGINRSTAFCMAALKEVEGLSLLDAYKEIKRKHPESLPNMNLCGNHFADITTKQHPISIL